MVSRRFRYAGPAADLPHMRVVVGGVEAFSVYQVPLQLSLEIGLRGQQHHFLSISPSLQHARSAPSCTLILPLHLTSISSAFLREAGAQLMLLTRGS